jgi:hypothetical protein
LRKGDKVKILSVLQDEGYPYLGITRVIEMENVTANSRSRSLLAGVYMATPTIDLQPPTIGRIVSVSNSSTLSENNIANFTIEEGKFEDSKY